MAPLVSLVKICAALEIMRFLPLSSGNNFTSATQWPGFNAPYFNAKHYGDFNFTGVKRFWLYRPAGQFVKNVKYFNNMYLNNYYIQCEEIKHGRTRAHMEVPRKYVPVKMVLPLLKAP